MKQGTLKIGVSEPKFSVTVAYNKPETIEEMTRIAQGHLPYILDCFSRGDRISRQESEARQTVADMVAGKSQAQLADPKFVAAVTKAVEAVLAKFDPKAERKRGGRPAKPVNVQVDANKKYTAAEMQALLAAAGAKVQFVPAEKASK